MSNGLSLFKIRNILPLFGSSGRTQKSKGDLNDLYDLLEAYYHNNGLYEVAAAIFGNDLQPEGLAALRTPAQRVVEFYTGAIWPGSLPDALPIKTDNERIVEPIHRIWAWSNWASKKQLAVRRFAMFGDMILKVARRDKIVFVESDEEEVSEEVRPSSVFVEVVNPRNVPDGSLILDERGNVIYIRIDIPKVRTDSGSPKPYTHTEIWTKQSYRLYEHHRGFNAAVKSLGEPIEELPLSEFGIDFVPFVYAPFRMVDELARGVGAYTFSLGKIDELNRMATRLHYLLFRYNKAVWGLASNMVDSAGRPVVVSLDDDDDSSGKMVLGDDDVLKLPGNSTLEALVPSLQYGEYLAAIEAQNAELEKDMPELAYARLRDKGELSGRAINLLLGDAIARAVEARGNAEDALIRAHKMALTMGVEAGLFSDIGSFDNGDFDHSFLERPIIRTTDLDRAEIATAYRDLGLAIKTTLERAGWQDDQIQQALADLEEESTQNQANFAAATLEAARRFESGEDSNGIERPESDADGDLPVAQDSE